MEQFPTVQWVNVVKNGMSPNIVNSGTISLPISLSVVFTSVGLVTDGLGTSQLQGNWVKASVDALTYQIVSQNASFTGGTIQAIVLGK